MKLSKLLPTKIKTPEKHSSTDPQKPVSPDKRKKGRSAATTKKTYELPTYLAKELRLKAASESVTERYIILRALKEAGFTVEDEDLVIDRRFRSK